MIQAVALGMVGVFASQADLQAAEAVALADWIEAHGGSRQAALDAAADAGPGWQSAALRAAGFNPQSGLACEAVLSSRHAPPAFDPGRACEWIEPIRSELPIALLDSGPRGRLEAWSAGLGLAAKAVFRLWTADLGADASPPRPLAFRWLARRLDLAARECFYVAGRPELALAARAAGWQTVTLQAPLDPGVDWRAVLAARPGGR